MDTDILIVSSSEQTCQLIQMELGIEGYSVLVETDSTLGFMTARKTQPRMLILELGTPGLPAIEVCNRLRATAPDLKIILLTDSDKELSVSFPVDDFIFMPLSLTELLLRVGKNLSQQSSLSASVLCFEDLSLNLDSHEVYRGQRLVGLTPKEFALLAHLLQNPQQVISRDRLLEKVWDYDFNTNHNILHVCIRSLRSKLESAGERRLIQTVRGVGYVLRPFNQALQSVQTRALAQFS
ncbi:MAG: response regulator transcription factor [Phormidesmis sp.]|mgnify:CR=1 FL=1